MGRKPSNNATYFMLDWDTHNHRKVKVVRSKYGLEGYAVYVLLLQRLSHSDGVEFPDTPDEIEFLAADFGCDEELIRNVLDTCYRVGLFVRSEAGFFHAERLKELLQSINNKRKRDRERMAENLEFASENHPNQEFSLARIPKNQILVSEKGEIREDKIREEKRREEGEGNSLRSQSQIQILGSDSDLELDEDREDLKLDGSERKKPKQKLKPMRDVTYDEVGNYFVELGMATSKAQSESKKFLDHYAASGFKQSNGNSIKDWKATVRNWYRRMQEFTNVRASHFSHQPAPGSQHARATFEHSDDDFARIIATNTGKPVE